jgi:hypothetical protein
MPALAMLSNALSPKKRADPPNLIEREELADETWQSHIFLFGQAA